MKAEVHQEEDDENTSIVRAKWSMDNATTLSEAAEMLRDYATYLEKLEKEAHRIASVMYEKAGPQGGAPPPGGDGDGAPPPPGAAGGGGKGKEGVIDAEFEETS